MASNRINLTIARATGRTSKASMKADDAIMARAEELLQFMTTGEDPREVRLAELAVQVERLDAAVRPPMPADLRDAVRELAERAETGVNDTLNLRLSHALTGEDEDAYRREARADLARIAALRSLADQPEPPGVMTHEKLTAFAVHIREALGIRDPDAGYDDRPMALWCDDTSRWVELAKLCASLGARIPSSQGGAR
jgi:hypothetical protein